MELHNTGPPSAPQPLNGVEKRRTRMGASGKMDAEIPPDAREQCLRFKLRPDVRVLASYSVVPSRRWRTVPLCALGTTPRWW